MIREKLQAAHADYMLFSCLDEIAWLYNVRCNDIIYNPVAISYAVVGKAKAWLFIKNTKVSREIASQLSQEGIEIRDYHHLFFIPGRTRQKFGVYRGFGHLKLCCLS